ncbi:hypothetical protein MAH1_31840 [Sessilibacter sp. MAH1]
MQKISRPQLAIQDFGVKGMLRSLKTLIGLSLLVLTTSIKAGEPLPITPFDIPQGAYSAEFIRDRDQVTVMEFTGNLDRSLSGGEFNAAARAVIAQEFYEHHSDTYDFLVVFSSFEYDTGDALAFHAGVRNDIQGLGIPLFDNSALYGSDGRLQSYIDMAALSRYEINPTQLAFNRVINTLSHELLHRWGTRVNFRNENNESDDSLLGRQNAHWSFFLDSDASVEYGSDWRNNGDGTYTAVATDFFYSPLDLYLMGFYGSDQVPPLTLLNSTTEEFNRTNIPVRGVTIAATPRTVTIDQIIAEEGPRIPNEVESQKDFRFAFIYIVAPNEEPAQEVFNGLRDIRRHFAERFAITTGGKGIATIFPEPEPVELGELDLVVSDEAFRVDGISIDDGIDWLLTQRGSNPFWQDKESTRLRDTLVVTETLRELVSGYSSDPEVLRFLRDQSVNNTDSLARLLSVLLDETFSEQLLERQNTNGGWGLLPGYDSNALDTALAYTSLVNSNRSFNQSAAVDFLLSQQNDDGGWPSVSGSKSTVRATVAVLNALVNIDDSSAVNAGLSWLSQQTDSSGGFGDADASVHETALVIRTFARLQQLESINFTAALTFITERQRLGGHWEGSVYSTALAISALQSVNLPNLRALNISVDNTDPVDGELVSITTIVNNDSSQNVSSVLVQFFADNNGSRISLNDPITIAELPAYSSVAVNTVWNTFEAAGSYELIAVIDVNNAVLERSENDNRQTLNITVSPPATQVELAVSNADFIVTPNKPNRLPVDIAISSTARNLGLIPAAGITAQLLRNDELVAESLIDVPARGSVALNFVDQLASPGIHEYRIILDASDSVAEEDETNNTALQTVVTQPGIDLEITQSAIVSPDTSILFNDVNFIVTIYNRSTIDAVDAEVVFNVINVEGTTRLETQTINVPAGQSVTREVLWRANVSGETNFQVILDPSNLIAELDESNNDVVKSILVNVQTGANASVNFRTIDFNPEPALQGLDTVVTAQVSNSGTEILSGLEVSLFDNNPNNGGRVLDTIILPDIDVGEESLVTLVWEATPELGSTTLYVVADPSNAVVEINEDDNIAFDSLTILSLPDIEVSSGSLVLAPVLPVPNEPATLTITATNIGNQSAENIPVSVFIDGIALIGDFAFNRIEGNGDASIQVPISFNSEGEHRISVTIDPNNTIPELQVTNNQAERTINIQNGNFYVSERYISPDGNGEKDFSEFNFTLDQSEFFEIVILDENNDLVASLNNNFPSNTAGSAVWTGRRTNGAVVADGDYWFTVRNKATGAALGSAKVVVDTNRSPLFEAIDSEFGVTRNLSCAVGEILDFQANNSINSRGVPAGGLPGPIYDSNDEFIYFATFFEGVNDPQSGNLLLTDDRTRFRSGLYRAFNDGSNVTQLVPDDFSLQVQGNTFEFKAGRINNIIVSPDGRQVAVSTRGQFSSSAENIWLLNSDGSNRRLVFNQSDFLSQVGSISGRIISTTFARSGTSLLLTNYDQSNSKLDLYEVNYSQQLGDQFPSVLLINTIDLNLYSDIGLELSPTVVFNNDGTKALIKFETTGFTEEEFNRFAYVNLLLERENNHLFWLDLNTSNLEYLTPRGSVFEWSPDGRRFAFGNGINRTVEVRGENNRAIQKFSFSRQFPESLSIELLENTGLNPSRYPSTDMLYGRFAALSWSPDGIELGVLIEDYLDVHLRYCYLCATQDFPTQLVENYNRLQGVYTLNTRDSSLKKIAEVAPLPPASFDGELISDGDDLSNSGSLLGFERSRNYFDQLENFPIFNSDIIRNNGLPLITWVQSRGWIYRNATSGFFNSEFSGFVDFGFSVDGNFQWLPGSRSILITAGPENNFDSQLFRFPIFSDFGLFGSELSLINVDDPSVNQDNLTSRFPVGGYTNAIRSSNTGRFLTYFNTRSTRQCSVTIGNYEQFQSLLNLSVDLRARVSRTQGGIIIDGTAVDKNFDSWILEYASSQTPNDWILISPASNELVIDEQLTTWVPPSRGSFFIRLTATDKAGNSRSDITQVSYSEDTSITNVFRQPAYISPNGDGIQDNLEVHFRVLQPVNISIQIQDESGEVVRTISQSYDEVGIETQLSWDGRNNSGALLPDGIYRVLIQNFEFFVTLDRTNPLLTELNNQFSWGVRSIVEAPYTNRCFTPLTSNGELCATYISEMVGYVLSDANLSQQIVEVSEPGRANWQVTDLIPVLLAEESTTDFLIPVSYELLALNDYRIVARDRSGNESVLIVGKENQNKVEAVRAVTIGAGEQIVLRSRDALAYSSKTFDLDRTIISGDNNTVVVEISESIQKDIRSIELLFAPIINDLEPLPESFLPIFIDSLAPLNVNIAPDSLRADQFIPTSSLLSPVSLFDYNLIDSNFVAIFDRSANGLNPEVGYYIRARITDSSDTHYLSKSFILPPGQFSYGLLDGVLVDRSEPTPRKTIRSFITNTDLEFVQQVSLFAQSSADARFSQRRRLDSYLVDGSVSFIRSTNGLSVSPSLSVEQVRVFPFDVSLLDSCSSYDITVEFQLSDGRVLTDSDTVVSDCGEIDFSVIPPIPESCEISAEPELTVISIISLPEGVNAVEDELDYSVLTFSMVDENGNEEIFANVNAPRLNTSYSSVFNARNLVDGIYEFRTTLFDSSGEILSLESQTIPYETSPPSVEILSPLNNQKICANSFIAGDASSLLNAVEITAEISGRDSLFYRLQQRDSASPENTDESIYCNSEANASILENFVCINSTAEKDSDLEIELFRQNQISSLTLFSNQQDFFVDNIRSNLFTGVHEFAGTAGFATYANSQRSTVTLSAYNWSGKNSCAVVEFEIDAEVEGFEVVQVAIDGSISRFFSPNQDGIQDQIAATIRTEEFISVDVELFQGIIDPDTNSLIKGLSSGLITTNLELDAGNHNFTWNGQLQSGQIPADGTYILEFKAQDSCGLFSIQQLILTIDNSAPNVELVYPRNSDLLGLNVEVSGSVHDVNIVRYEVFVTEVSSGNRSLVDVGRRNFTIDDIAAGRYLASWNTFGLSGNFTLEIEATDLAGNKTTVSELLDLALVTDLISEFSVTEPYTSPNDDGLLDAAVIRTRFEAPSIASFSVLNSAGNLVRTISSDVNYEATFASLTWDGRSDSGDLLPNGPYTLVVDARSIVSSGLTQQEQTTIVLDVTAPAIVLDNFTDERIELSGSNIISGSIFDALFDNYSVRLISTPNGNVNNELVSSQVVPAGQILVIDSATFDVEGFYRIEISATDFAQNRQTISASLLIDNTAPKIVLAEPRTNLVISSEQEVLNIHGQIVDEFFNTYSVELIENIEGALPITIIDDQSSVPSDLLASIDLSTLAEAEYIVSVIARDLSGLTTRANIQFSIDNTLPTVSIDSIGNNGFLMASDVINGTIVDENLRNYQVAISSGVTTSDNGQFEEIFVSNNQIIDGQVFNFSQLPEDGQYTLSFTAADLANNIQSEFTSIIIDTTPPKAPVLGDIVFNNNLTAVLSWSAVEVSDLAGYRVFRNGQLISQDLLTETHYEDVNLSEGDYHYVVLAVDNANLESLDSNERNLRVDLTGPEVVITSPLLNQKVSGLVDINGTAYSETDFARYSVFVGVDENSMQLITESTLPQRGFNLAQWNSLLVNSNQQYILRLQAEDQQGNISTTEINIEVDNDPPQPVTNVQATIIDGDINITWDFLGELNGIEGFLLYRNGQLLNAPETVVGDLSPYVISETSYTDAGLVDDEYFYSVFVLDETGNISLPSDEARVVLNNNLPHATIVNVEDGQRFENSLYLIADSEDNDLASVEFSYRVDATQPWQLISVDALAPFETEWDSSSLPFANYQIRALAIDNFAGIDPSPEILNVIQSDITPPSEINTLNVSVIGSEASLTWTNTNVESDFASYSVYVENLSEANPQRLLLSSNVTETRFTHINHDLGEMRYSVGVIDLEGNESILTPVKTELFTPEFTYLLSPRPSNVLRLSGNTIANAEIFLLSSTDSNEQIITSLGFSDVNGDYSVEGQYLLPGENNLVIYVRHPIYGSISNISEQVITYIPPPSKVDGLLATYNDQDFSVNLQWQENTDSDFYAYSVIRDGVPIHQNSSIEYSDISANNSSSRFPVGNIVRPGQVWVSNAATTLVTLAFGRTAALTSIVVSGSVPNIEVMSTANGVLIPVTRVGSTLTLDTRYITDAITLRFTGSSSYRISSIETFEIPLIQDTHFTDFPEETNIIHNYQVSAFNLAVGEGPLSDPISVVVGDVVAPEPVVLSASLLGPVTELSWETSVSSDASDYRIYRNNELIATVTSVDYVDGPLINGTYSYFIRTVDVAGNISEPSNSVTLTVAEPLISPPVELSATADVVNISVSLDWLAAPGSNPVSYQIYRRSGSESEFSILGNTSGLNFIDNTIIAGVNYHYVVRAIDNIGNLSIESNSVQITVNDDIAPMKPIIYLPTTSDVPLDVDFNSIFVAGEAELGTEVFLAANGNIISEGVKLPIQNAEAVSTNGTLISTSISKNGRAAVVYSSNDSGILRNHAYSQQVDSWSQESAVSNLATPTFWRGDQLILVDAGFIFSRILLTNSTFDDNTTTQLSSEWEHQIFFRTEPLAYFEDTDELLAYADIPQLGGYDLYAINIESGEARVFNYFNWRFISRDGRFFIDTFNVNDDVQITIWDRFSEVAQIYTVSSLCCIDEIEADSFSRDGTRILYSKQNSEGTFDLVMYDLLTQELSVLDSGFINRPTDLTWSFSEQGFYFIDRDAQATLKYHRFSEGDQITLFTASIDESNELSISGAGLNRIVLSSGFDNFYYIDLAGVFSFDNVPLELGSNSLTVLSVDGSQNVSEPADNIILNRIDNIADLSISVDILQNAITVGVEGTTEISVQNRGTIISDPTDLVVIAILPTGEEVELLIEQIPSLAPNEVKAYTVKINTTTVTGEYSIVASVNNSNRANEINYSNNIVSNVLTVLDQLLPYGDLLINPSAQGGVNFVANETLIGTFRVINPGSQIGGRYSIRVEDLNDFVVEILQEGQLSQNASDINFNWSTASYFADSYKIVAELYDISDELVNSQNFEFFIIPTLNLISGVTSDRATYSAYDSVNLRGTVVSQNSNTLFNRGRVEFIVRNSSNLVVFESSSEVGQLLPGTSLSVVEVWNTQAQAPGDYLVTLNVIDSNNNIRSTSTNLFNIRAGEPNLSGNLSISESILSKGRLVESTYSLTNLSNRTLVDVSLTAALIDPETNIVLNNYTTNIDLLLGETLNFTSSFETNLLELGTYQIRLFASVTEQNQDFDFELAIEPFVLQDSTAPEIEILNPLDGDIINSLTSFALIEAIDEDSLINLVEYSINGENWFPVNRNDTNNSSYRLLLDELIDGTQHLFLRATDDAGNRSNIVSREFTVDNTAPEIVVEGVVNGRFYNEFITPTFTAIDPHFVSLVITLDDEPYIENTSVSLEGEHIFNLIAIDTVGNINQTVIVFGIDTTPPSIIVNGIDDNGVYNTPVTPLIETDEETPLSFISQLNGETYQLGTTIGNEGDYQLLVNVVDGVGNESEIIIGFRIDLTAPDVPSITSHVNNQSVDQEMVNISGTAEVNSQVSLVNQNSNEALIVISDSSGNFTFSGVPLNVGNNSFEITSIDRAGNRSPSIQLTLNRSVATTADIVATQNYVGNSVLVLLPPKNLINHPDCDLWIHRNHPIGYAHAHEDTEALFELLVETFEESNIRYKVVRNENDFIEALRSQRYNSVLLAHLHESYNLPLVIKGDTLLELRASIAAGTGAIVITNTHNSFGVWRDVLGAKLNRILIDPKSVTLQDSVATEVGTWDFSDRRAVELDGFGGLSVGSIEHQCHRLTSRRCEDSALVINRYGKGDVAVLGFNPAGINDAEAGKVIANNLIEFVRPDQPIILPGGLIELNWIVEGLQPPVNIYFEQTLEPGLIYDTVIDGNLISDRAAIWNTTLSEASNLEFNALINLPDEPGNFEVNSDLIINGSLTTSNIFIIESPLAVEDIELGLESNLENALQNAVWNKKGLYKLALNYVQQAIVIDKSNRKNIDKAINDLLLATFKLKLLEEDQLISEIGQLLKIYQRQWYELPEYQNYGKYKH